MGCFVYNVTKAPIGWSLFRDRERGFVSKGAVLEAATAAGADALREGHSIQINVPPSELVEEAAASPAGWRID
jgi:hypothetical protein